MHAGRPLLSHVLFVVSSLCFGWVSKNPAHHFECALRKQKNLKWEEASVIGEVKYEPIETLAKNTSLAKRIVNQNDSSAPSLIE